MQKLLFSVGLGWLLCAWVVCMPALAADQQVIVEGAHRASETVRTSGHTVPLLHAIEEVVPANYSVNVPNAGSWADAPVSWHAGGSFVHVLGELLSGDPSLQARVDTDLHLVTVSARAPLRQPALAAWPSAASGADAPNAPLAASKARSTTDTNAPVTPVAKTLAPSSSPSAAAPVTVAGAPGLPLAIASAAPALPAASAAHEASPPSSSTLAPAAASAPEPAAPPERTVWELRRADGSVRNALARWASEAGWQFIWDVPTDFTVDADATIHGSLQHALHEVANALGNSQVPIQVVMYQGNHVLRVIPKGAG
ncbi:toxin co-regulated pilus biosynthesis Q family protein [Paraburkholderia solisilvae]|uniref:Toxin co-regulated pilus biosynthesis protein Q C-terminal domain-containing protein n=1 Tax=Paraburkholderia solisilvae TaxID=624376 RepID=A0A6J5ES58_9BURK|nr:toxin co-regulated pilus biosynthesis Q family protein [Paraburkholderia solisilvae]CAB3769398.1 hypothetical protein LMG29739_05534 [Paraburkholderia solisilvae]